MAVTESPGAPGGPSLAWGYWPVWKGRRELLVRVARVAVQAARRTGAATPSCNIRVVLLDEDVERFESPDEFKDHLTTTALQFPGFRFVHIDVRARGCDVEVLFVRWRTPGLPRGVFLGVTPAGAPNRRLAVELRDELSLAIARATPKQEASHSGETWHGAFWQDAVAVSERDRRRPRTDTRVIGAMLTAGATLPVLLAIDSLLGGVLFTRLPQARGSDEIVFQTKSGWAALAALAAIPAGLVLGATVIGPMVRLGRSKLPSVAVREHGGWDSRLLRAASTTLGQLILTAALLALFAALTGIQLR